MSESCTSPTLGLLDCAEMTCCGTAMSSRASAWAAGSWGACTFISSPS